MHVTAHLRGPLFMSLAMAGFVINDTMVKTLSENLAMGQIIILRGLVASLFIITLAWSRNALAPLSTLANPLVLVRTLSEVLATLSFLTALANIPLANATAILQALPLATTMGAALFLGEPVGWRRWSAIMAGFIGVLIIIRPGLEGFTVYSLSALATVFFAAMRDIATRRIGTRVPSLFLTAITAPAVTLSGIFMIGPFGGWQPVNVTQGATILAAALFLLVGYQGIIMAMRAGDVATTAPFRYSGLVFAMFLGYAVFGDVPDPLMIIGSLIIVGSGLYAFHREQARRRRQEAQRLSQPRIR